MTGIAKGGFKKSHIKKSFTCGGFMLVESVVYVALAAMLISLTYVLALSWSLRVNQQQQILNRDTQVDAVLDLWWRDICRSPSDKSRWKRVSTHELIWTDGTRTDIGWRVERGRLARITGFYNTTVGRWTKKHADMLLSSAQVLTFVSSNRVVAGHESLSGITLNLSMGDPARVVIKHAVPRAGYDTRWVS